MKSKYVRESTSNDLETFGHIDTTCETVGEIISKVDFQSQKLVILLNKTDIYEVNKNVNIINYIVSSLDNKGIICNLIKEDPEGAKFDATNKNSENSDVQIIPTSAKTGSGI